MKRGAGLLVHITSLPDAVGYGCFSKEAFSFVDFLSNANLKYWQILPLGPIDEVGSPYNNQSFYAIDPMHICLEEYFSVDELSKKGLSKKITLSEYKKIKFEILREIYAKQTKKTLSKTFAEKNKSWLDDYATFMTLQKVLKCAYEDFPLEYKDKNSSAVRKIIRQEKDEINFHKFTQELAFSQWKKIKNYANKKGIVVIGDAPFYPSSSSDSVWAEPQYYQIENNKFKYVSGVPADYFNPDGQVWNTPVYNIKKIKEENCDFVVKRYLHLANLYDFTRIDHFRGLDAFYKIPADKPLAKFGKWEKGLGFELFKKFKENKITNLICEDLGKIDEKVLSLKEKTKLPGMKVFQFAFDGNTKNPFLPNLFEKNCVAYLGTHDNDTFCGFLKNEGENTKKLVLKTLNLYEGSTDEQICYSAINSMLSSNADVVILTPQDILCQGTKARMNEPGTTKNNWQYVMPKKIYSKSIIDYLTSSTRQYNR